jgi:hypothetical protein
MPFQHKPVFRAGSQFQREMSSPGPLRAIGTENSKSMVLQEGPDLFRVLIAVFNGDVHRKAFGLFALGVLSSEGNHIGFTNLTGYHELTIQ